MKTITNVPQEDWSVDRVKALTMGRITAKTPARAARRPAFAVAVAVAAVLTASLSFGVLAAGINPFNALHGILGGGAENEGFNVGVSSVSDGVELTLTSAVADEKYLYAFITLKDTEGDRLDANLAWDIINGKNRKLFGGNVYAAGLDVLDYDAAEKAVTAVIRLEGDKGFSAGDRIELGISDISSGFRTFEAEEDIDLRALAGAVPGTLAYADEIGGYGSGIYSEYSRMTARDFKALRFLERDTLNIAIGGGMDWGVLTGVGYIDGKLHIQYRRTDSYRSYYEGDLILCTAEGNRVPEAYNVTFDAKGGVTGVYIERVYDIAPDALDGCRIVSNNTFSNPPVGDWKLAFTVESIMESRAYTLRSADANIGVMNVRISPVTTVVSYKMRGVRETGGADGHLYWMVNPLGDSQQGVHVSGEGGAVFFTENYLLLADGSRVDLKMQSGSTNLEPLEVDITFISQYYDIGGLAAIVLDGERFILE
jgi:hypothetical protein